MKSMRHLAPLAVAVLAVTGCAFTKSTLDLGLEPTNTARGPLSVIPPATFAVAMLVDKRPDTDRIGYKRNGFGSRTADIVAARPVPAIVRDALAAELSANGHRVDDAGDVVVAGDVTTFWFDTVVNFGSLEFSGLVAANLTFVDTKTGRTLVTRIYQGHYAEKTMMGGFEGTWQRIMNTALERMVREVATDPRLLAALRTRTAATSAVREE